jgi:hypothetical protein
MLTSLVHFVRTVLLAIFVIIALVVLTYFAAWPWGWLKAQSDLRQGKYEIKRGGLMRGTDDLTAQLLKDRYGVKCSSVGGCMMLPHQISYMEGYNSASKSAIIKHFGKDTFTEIRKDVRAQLDKQDGH